MTSEEPGSADAPREATVAPAMTPAMAPAAPPLPTALADIWWLARGQQVTGPYTPDQLRRLADLGHLLPQDQLRRHVGDSWTPWQARASELGLTTSPSAATIPSAPPIVPMAVPVAPPAPQPGERVLEYVVPIHVGPFALLAGYAGLIGLGCLPLGPVAIVLGVMGLKRLRPGQPGAFRCWTGIVLGFIGSAFLVIVIGAYVANR